MYKYFPAPDVPSSKQSVQEEITGDTTGQEGKKRILDGTEDMFIPFKLEKPLSLDKYKLKYCLQKYERECTSGEFFWAAVGIFFTILLTKATTKFQDTLGFSAGAWEGFFLFVGLSSLLVIIWIAISKALRVIQHKKMIGIQDVLKCANSEDPDN